MSTPNLPINPELETANETTSASRARTGRRVSRKAAIGATIVAALAIIGVGGVVSGKVSNGALGGAPQIHFVRQSTSQNYAAAANTTATTNAGDLPFMGALAAEKPATISRTTGKELLHDASDKKVARPTMTSLELANLKGTQVVWMEVTAYCPCPKCCGAGAIGLTASGKRVTFNGGRFVAADAALPFGTKLVVPGYNNGRSVEVADRGGAIRGNKLDVFFPTHDQATAWGRRWIAVTVVR
jgi:3D (Asp-Asp-Asp) domain-containing protein